MVLRATAEILKYLDAQKSLERLRHAMIPRGVHEDTRPPLIL